MLEVVRLKFQWNWPTPGKFTWKVDGEQSCKSQLFKVTNKGKPPWTFPYNLTKNSVEFLPLEISSKKVHGKNVDIFRLAKLPQTKHVETTRIFWTIEITSKKYVEMTWKFVEIWSSTYWCNIHAESTSIRRGMPDGMSFNYGPILLRHSSTDCVFFYHRYFCIQYNCYSKNCLLLLVYNNFLLLFHAQKDS